MPDIRQIAIEYAHNNAVEPTSKRHYLNIIRDAFLAGNSYDPEGKPDLEPDTRVGTKLSLAQAQRERRCRVCGEKIELTGLPEGYHMEFNSLLKSKHENFTGPIIFNHGKEFAHKTCLEALENG